MQQLDLRAYRNGDQSAFLKSIQEAKRILFSDKETVEQDLRAVKEKLSELKHALAEGEKIGCRMAYQRVDARVVESFIQYVLDDLGDGETHHTIRALWTTRYLGHLCTEVLAQARNILSDPSRDLVVPTYQTGPVEIREGAFWQEDRPVFFTGVGHFGQVKKDIPILNDYGINIIQIEMGPNSVVLGPEETDDRPIREDILRNLDLAAQNDVAVNLLISPHYFPGWALERYPGLTECGLTFNKHCIDAPESREIYERYMRALMPLIANHPALHSICLSNEPQYDGRCKHSLVAFHKWLAQKHQSIDRLNGIYGKQYSSFDQVPFPEEGADRAPWFDYYRFNQDRFLEFHEFLRDLIHEFDPDLPVHAKVMSHSFFDPGKFEVGVNYEDFTLLGKIAGNDCIQIFVGDDEGEYLQRWQDMATNYTFQRSVAPGWRHPVRSRVSHPNPLLDAGAARPRCGDNLGLGKESGRGFRGEPPHTGELREGTGTRRPRFEPTCRGSPRPPESQIRDRGSLFFLIFLADDRFCRRSHRRLRRLLLRGCNL
jgi:hypothetical protein